MNFTEKDIARFRSKVGPPNANGCCLWMAGKGEAGYGYFKAGGKGLRANRVAWTIAHGPIPDGLGVFHHCDVPACCRVDHLWVGTSADNNADMVAKGRQAKGDKNGARTRPERLPRGDAHYSRTRPERLPRGDSHGRHTKPERTARGGRHGRHTKPERTARGDRHGAHLHPEKLSRGQTHGSRTKPEKIPRGESQGSAKLTDEDVKTIRARYEAGGIFQRELAREFGVSSVNIGFIVRRKSWAHVA
jgi:HNH endonuclease